MKSLVNLCVIGSGRAGNDPCTEFCGIGTRRAFGCHGGSCRVGCPFVSCEELGIDKYYLDYKDALGDKDIDAVVVVSPTVYHRSIVVDAATAGKHILMREADGHDGT